MKRGILYGVGVGPGDPELLTLKAARILRQADVIAAPDKGAGEQTALNIVKELVEGKPVLPCVTPMVRDKATLDACHDTIADQLCALLDEGKTVAFITLGDPTVYSTYLYIHKRVQARGYDVELIPGVPSFCAVAARLGRSLTTMNSPLHILPGGGEGPGETLDLPGAKVLMKSGRNFPQVLDELEKRGLLEQAAMVENCGLPGERICPSLEEKPQSSGYFTTIIIP